jgi:serine/threonine protein kinase
MGKVGNDNVKDFVLKQMRLPSDDDDTDHLPNPGSFRKIQREAIIMERLTSSAYIVNIHGHCGLSVLAETSEDSVVTTIIPQSDHVVQTNAAHFQSNNNLTSIEKLKMAIEMSQAIADIHGFSGGRIVHGDIHPVQWLRARKTGTLKLNDFNNAEILAVNRRRTANGNVTYCKTNRGDWSGSFRSPEELLGEPLDEKIDVYSMGNIIYTLLIGQVRIYSSQPKFFNITKCLLTLCILDFSYRIAIPTMMGK